MERFQSRADTLHRRTRKGQAMHDVIPGFDYSHFPPPKLHPGTRTTIMDKINDWFSQDSKRKVLWLNGPAGVGKSTISREFSDRVGTQTLAALFFANQCHDHVEVVPTIALEIAFTTERYKAYIVEKIDTSSLVTEMTVEEQFHALITNPIGEESLLDSGGAYLILLDALELCRGRQTSSISDGHLAKAAQMQIISLIARFAVDYPSAPIKWVISSRPEEHLKAVFSHPAVQPSYRELHVPISDEEACGDVRLYLEAAFQSIRQSHHLPSHWPGSYKLKKVAEAASGLFLFARDVKDFIYRGDPAAQLEFVLSAIDGSPSIILFGSPFVNLDASYEHIMSKIPTNVLADTHKILGHLLLRELFISSNLFLRYSLCSTANILGLDQFAVYRALSELHSVLYIPSPELAHKENIRFPHPSFYLYLKDKTRSEHYSINLPEVNKYIWKRYSQILQEANQDVSRQRQKRKPVITLSWPLNGSKFEKQKWISGLLYEAKYHWAHFLIPQCLCSDKLISRSLAPVSLSDQERLDAVCSINFKNLIDGYFAEESGHIELFFAFLRGLWQSSRTVLEEHGLSEKVIFSGSRDSNDTEARADVDRAISVSGTTNLSEGIDESEEQTYLSSEIDSRLPAFQVHPWKPDDPTPPNPKSRRTVPEPESDTQEAQPHRIKEKMVDSKRTSPSPRHPDRPAELHIQTTTLHASPSLHRPFSGPDHFVKQEESPTYRRPPKYGSKHEHFAGAQFPRHIDSNALPNEPHRMFSLPTSPISEATQGEWDQITELYSPQEIVDRINFLRLNTKHLLSFVNIDFLSAQIYDDVERFMIQPTFILAALALAQLIQSSVTNQGTVGMAQAVALRLRAQTAVDEARQSGLLNVDLAKAQFLLAIFEYSAYTEHSYSRATSALHALDDVITSLSLTTLDARNPSASSFPLGSAPAVYPEDGPSLAGKICKCLPREVNDALKDYQSSPVYHLPWHHDWTRSETQNEEIRRLCWSALSLVSDHNAQCLMLGRVVPNFSLNHSSNFVLLFPGEAFDRLRHKDPSDPLLPNESVWGLYCRSLLLWNFCVSVKEGHTAVDDKIEAFTQSVGVAQMIEDALNVHRCNLDTTIMHQTREYLFNIRTLVAHEVRVSVVGLSTSGRPGMLFSTKHVEEWVRAQRGTIQGVKSTIHHSGSGEDNKLTRQPFAVSWFVNQLNVAVLIWPYEQSMVGLLELAKDLLYIVDILNYYWECPENSTRTEGLRGELIKACLARGVAPPLTTSYVPRSVRTKTY